MIVGAVLVYCIICLILGLLNPQGHFLFQSLTIFRWNVYFLQYWNVKFLKQYKRVQFHDFGEKYQKALASESGNGLSMFDDKYLFTCTQLVQVQALAQFILDGKNRVPFIF